MTRSGPLLALVVLLAAGLPSQAGDRLAVGVKAGTLGLGVDVTGRLTDRLSVRGTFSSADVSRTQGVSGIDYDATLNLGAYGVLVDFHPFKGSFRLSAGWMHNRTGLDLVATPTKDVKIGGTTYAPGEVGTLRGDIGFKESVPYFGLGLGNAAKAPGRIRFLMDAGVLSQGAGDTKLTSSRNLVSRADLRSEEADVNDKVDHVKLWPVLSFGISCRI